MKKAKPKTRFQLYKELWVSKKLCEISNKVTEKNVAFLFREVFTNSAKYGIMNQQDFYNHAIANDKSINGYYVVRPNDFVYNPRMSDSAPVGPINRNSLGRVGIMSPLYYVFRTQNIDVEYLEYFFKTRYWHQFMWNNGDNGARGDRFSIKNEVFQQMPVSYPENSKEQHEIALFFRHVDEILNAEDKKLVRLKNFKQASLEKIFPKKGETKPQVRFKGFSNDWNIGKLCEFASYYRISNEKIHHQNLLSLSYGKIIRKNIKSKRGLLPASFDTYQVIKENVIVLRFTDLQNDHKSLRVGIAKEEGIISPAYVCLECKGDINPDYLYLLLHYYDLSKIFYSMGDGLRQTLSFSDIKDLEIQIPENREQKKIVSFFVHMDKLISAQEQRIAKLRSLKKSFLEKMFVSAQ